MNPITHNRPEGAFNSAQSPSKKEKSDFFLILLWKNFAEYLPILSQYFQMKVTSLHPQHSSNFQRMREFSTVSRCQGKLVYPTNPFQPLNDYILVADQQGLATLQIKGSTPKKHVRFFPIFKAAQRLDPLVFKNLETLKGSVSLVGNDILVLQNPHCQNGFFIVLANLLNGRLTTISFPDLMDIAEEHAHPTTQHHHVLNHRIVFVCLNRFPLTCYCLVDIVREKVVCIAKTKDPHPTYLWTNDLLAIEVEGSIQVIDISTDLRYRRRFSRTEGPLALLGIHQNRIYSILKDGNEGVTTIYCFEKAEDSFSFSQTFQVIPAQNELNKMESPSPDPETDFGPNVRLGHAHQNTYIFENLSPTEGPSIVIYHSDHQIETPALPHSTPSNTPHLSSLPTEILDHVFKFLGIIEFCKKRRVCHDWKAIIESSLPWQQYTQHLPNLSLYFPRYSLHQVEKEWKTLAPQFLRRQHFLIHQVSSKKVFSGSCVFPKEHLQPCDDHVLIWSKDRRITHLNFRTGAGADVPLTSLNDEGLPVSGFSSSYNAMAHRLSLVGSEHCVLRSSDGDIGESDLPLHIHHIPTNTLRTVDFEKNDSWREKIDVSLAVLNAEKILVSVRISEPTASYYYHLNIAKGTPPVFLTSNHVLGNAFMIHANRLAIKSAHTIQLFDNTSCLLVKTLTVLPEVDKPSTLHLLGIYHNRVYCDLTDDDKLKSVIYCYEQNDHSDCYTKRKIEIPPEFLLDSTGYLQTPWAWNADPSHFFTPHFWVHTGSYSPRTQPLSFEQNIIRVWNLDIGEPIFESVADLKDTYQLVGGLLFYSKNGRLVVSDLKTRMDLMTFCKPGAKLIRLLEDGIILREVDETGNKRVSVVSYQP